jgi:hypothetical protein
MGMLVQKQSQNLSKDSKDIRNSLITYKLIKANETVSNTYSYDTSVYELS